jgi:hypothetical protein
MHMASGRCWGVPALASSSWPLMAQPTPTCRYQDRAQQDAAVLEAAYRRDFLKQQAACNQQLAQNRSGMSSTAKQAELAANFAEIDANLTSALLTEDPLTATSALSPYRVRCEHVAPFTHLRLDRGEISQVLTVHNQDRIISLFHVIALHS